MSDRSIPASISILGSRGIPAAYGGFETLAENLALHLAARGWKVTVYCEANDAPAWRDSVWKGVVLRHVAVRGRGTAATVAFDFKSTMDAARHEKGVILVLGYNTGVFHLIFRLCRVPHVVNMDGFEWKRPKWPWYGRLWLRVNERLACWFGNHLVADHPVMETYFATFVDRSKISMITYGADAVDHADVSLLAALGLEPRRYVLMLARPQPENSALEIISAYTQKPRGMPLVVLGDYDGPTPFQRQVRAAGNAEVRFLGTLFDRPTLQALRREALLFIHGHQVGGTNPSLVEGLAAGSPVLAHENAFNRWVAGPGARYFSDQAQCAAALDELLADPEQLVPMRVDSRARHAQEFTWEHVLGQYEAMLRRWLPNPTPDAATTGERQTR